MLKVTGEHRAGFRAHVLYAMALGTGLREHELLALDVGDVFEGRKARRRLVLRVFKRSSDSPRVGNMNAPASPGRARDPGPEDPGLLAGEAR